MKAKIVKCKVPQGLSRRIKVVTSLIIESMGNVEIVLKEEDEASGDGGQSSQPNPSLLFPRVQEIDISDELSTKVDAYMKTRQELLRIAEEIRNILG